MLDREEHQKKQLRDLVEWGRAREALEAAGVSDDAINRIDNGIQASDLLQMIARSFVSTADPQAAKNYFTFAMDGLTAPFDHIQVEIVRKGGKHSTELVKELRDAAHVLLGMLKTGVDLATVAKYEQDLRNKGVLL